MKELEEACHVSVSDQALFILNIVRYLTYKRPIEGSDGSLNDHTG